MHVWTYTRLRPIPRARRWSRPDELMSIISTRWLARHLNQYGASPALTERTKLVARRQPRPLPRRIACMHGARREWVRLPACLPARRRHLLCRCRCRCQPSAASCRTEGRTLRYTSQRSTATIYSSPSRPVPFRLHRRALPALPLPRPVHRRSRLTSDTGAVPEIHPRGTVQGTASDRSRKRPRP
jgi:hypothetical protein